MEETYSNIVPTEEMWRQCVIPGFDNYWISSYGAIKNSHTNRELSAIDNGGYLQVQLSQNRRIKTVYIHRLVAQHYLTGWEEGIQVSWRDGDTKNNRLENLFFKGQRRLGTVVIPRKTYTERRLEVIETGQSFMNVTRAAKYLNTSPQGIYQVLTGRRQTHLGYHFRWIEI